MRVKSFHSLNLEELGVPAPDLSPVVYDSGVSVPQLEQSYSESWNIAKAFANYLVQRSRTRDMARQYAAMRSALDARNFQAECQSEIIIANYAKKLENFLAQQKEEMRLLTEKIALEGVAIAEQVSSERERQRDNLKLTVEILNHQLKYFLQMQEFLAKIENSSEEYVAKHRSYFQVQEDCRAKLRLIQRLLKNIGGENSNG